VRLAPPFGGITRIRFKGFVNDVSANSGSPESFTRSYGSKSRSQRVKELEAGSLEMEVGKKLPIF